LLYKRIKRKLNLEELTIFYKLNTAKPAQIKELEKQAMKNRFKGENENPGNVLRIYPSINL
jgi:hypothetical protein